MQAGEVVAAAVLAFLEKVVLPVYRRAGWTLRRVLTDRGKEFKGAFDAGLTALGIRHTRTKPRHAWTNGFVERFQGTILHEHWPLVFRRTYFKSVRQLQTTLTALFWSSTIDGGRTRGIACGAACRRALLGRKRRMSGAGPLTREGGLRSEAR